MRHTAIALVVAGTLVSGNAWSALYRWVDEDGTVHYSDKLPPEATQREREVLDDQGRRVGTYPAPKTPAQRAEEVRQREAAAAEQARREEEKRKDRVLLQTFTTVEEIEMARADRLAQIEAQIALTEGRLERLRREQDQLRQRVEAIEKQGNPVPPQLQEDYDTVRQALLDNEKFLQERRAEHTELAERFAADIERFKVLKAEEADGGPR